jgi:hypothetical protein
MTTVIPAVVGSGQSASGALCHHRHRPGATSRTATRPSWVSGVKIREGSSYYEDLHKTAARVFDQFADTTRHHLTSHDGHTVQIFEPELTDLQNQILRLLAIPPSATADP